MVLRAGVTIAFPLVLCACSPEPRWIAMAGTSPPSLQIAAATITEGISTSLPLPFTDGIPSVVRFNADGGSVYVASDAGELVYLRRADGGVLAEARFDGPISAVLFSARRQHVLVVARDSLFVLEAGGLQPLGRMALCAGTRGFVTVAPGDRGFASCAGDAVAVVDLELERVARVASLQLDAPCGAGAPVLARDEAELLLPCRDRAAVVVLDRLSLRVLATVALDDAARAIAAAPAGTYALALTAGNPVVLDLPRRRARPLALGGRPVAAVADRGQARLLLEPDRPGGGGPTTDLVTLRMLDGAVERVSLPGTLVALDVWPRERSPVMWWRR